MPCLQPVMLGSLRPQEQVEDRGRDGDQGSGNHGQVELADHGTRDKRKPRLSTGARIPN